MQETNHPTITSLPPSHTSTPPLAPIQGISTQASANDVVDTLSSPSAPFLVHSTRPLPAPSACSSPINPTAKAYPHKFDVHAMGSIDVVDKSDDPIDPQLNLDYTRVMIEYNNDIDDFLKFSASNSNENKKKKNKKKKKKKTSDPASIPDNPDNPVLFYV
ncbi:hypothetical protein Pst134EA_029436 [Puccinia striiformis f. sp. tritici]|nr:hypothetical protein Pst134EA_029436 [Puccinia striiformis f. sp. tritici]KAH9447398.1 hypothetical protein Pst134EA_029436 [Puccinia striiformis f. sp. tritici]